MVCILALLYRYRRIKATISQILAEKVGEGDTPLDGGCANVYLEESP